MTSFTDVLGGKAAISTQGTRPTYRFGFNAIGGYTAQTDLIQLVGSASKVIRLTEITIQGNATAGAFYDLLVIKRTTANTGGTATAKTASNADSNDPAQSATLNQYTAVPSGLGTGIVFDGGRLYLPPAGAAVLFTPLGLNYGSHDEKQPTLRGVAESICLNFGGVTLPTGLSLYITIEWTEDNA
jgi:hypothetical protein